MKESVITTKILKYLKSKGYAVKYHGNMYSCAGTPDILACIKGKFYGFEVKVPGREKTLTKLQEKALKEINEAGGIGVMVTSLEKVKEVLGDEN